MLLKDLQTLATKLATGTLFHVEKAGKAYSVDYSALAKAIIEEYADSTVGGSKQSVQAAIGALNSRTTVTNGVNYTNLNDLKSTAIYSYDTTSDKVQNAPDTGTYFSGTLYVTYYNANKIVQVLIRSAGDVWTRCWWNGTWRSWTKLANQSDVDALEARVTALENK